MPKTSEGLFPGYPRGWFVVAFSDELAPGGVRPMRYFGRDLVLYRAEDGAPYVLDAYCPHLGAHLGVGGCVEGGTIRCPFHAWRFDGAGRCVEIPYAQKIPSRARTEAWTVVERNHLIYLWHHPEGAAPDFEVPGLPIEDGDTWLPWAHSCIRIATHSKEIVENVVDVAHFQPIHGTHIDRFENVFEDEKAIQRSTGVAYPRGGGEDRFELTATYYGPGYQISDMKGVLHSLLVNAHTMVDEGTLDLRFGVSLKPTGDSERDARFAKGYIDNLTTGFLEDVAIWEHKLYRERPTLCGGDGAIMKLRRWYAQFYGPRAA